MDLAKEEIKAIQTEAEKEVGFPLVQDFWDSVEYTVGNAVEDFDGDPEGQESYIASYEHVTSEYIKLIDIVRPLINGSTDRNGERTPQPKKVYRKCFERRFYLVSFVMDRPYKRGTRIDWKRMVTEWNKSHPSDPMSLPALKVEFYRAKKELPLRLQYLVTGMLKIAVGFEQAFRGRAWQPFSAEVEQTMSEHYGKFLDCIAELNNLAGETEPMSEYYRELYQRILEVIESIYVFRRRKLLARERVLKELKEEKRLEEAQNER